MNDGDGNRRSDKDTRREETFPGRSEPSCAFNRAMRAVDARCAELSSFIENDDFEGVMLAAHHAANMWLVGRAACRRLVAGVNDSSLYARAAQDVLEARYMSLLELLVCAARTIAAPRMQSALHGARCILMAKMAEPLSRVRQPRERTD
jgi:hypothetical protein